MVAIYVGVTDGDWFRFLSQRPEITEVNFWQPDNTRRFSALAAGELLFKLKAPDNFIAGGGLFVSANAYPTVAGMGRFMTPQHVLVRILTCRNEGDRPANC
jgi:hypothetical protein